MYCGVIEGIAGLSVTLTRIAGGKSMVDGSLTVMANLNLSITVPFTVPFKSIRPWGGQGTGWPNFYLRPPSRGQGDMGHVPNFGQSVSRNNLFGGCMGPQFNLKKYE